MYYGADARGKCQGSLRRLPEVEETGRLQKTSAPNSLPGYREPVHCRNTREAGRLITAFKA